MRMPRIRFTVRRMMIAVAIVAMALEAGIVWRRYKECRERAAMLARNAAGLRRMVSRLTPAELRRGTSLDFEDGTPPAPATPESAMRMAARMDVLARKYARAARRPWLPVEPDRPMPE